MKMYYIANARIPTDKAHGIQILKMSEALTKAIGEKNYQVLLPNRFGSGKTEAGFISAKTCDKYGIKTKFKIKKLPVFDVLPLTDRWPGPIDFIAYFLETITFGISAALYCLINRPDVIYTRDFYLLPLLFLTKTPAYYESHYFPQTKIGTLFHKVFLPKIMGVIFIANSFSSSFRANNINIDNTIVLYNGADLDFFNDINRKKAQKLKKSLNISLSDSLVGYIGRLSGAGEDKGKRFLLAAFSEVAKSNSRAKFLIVGERREDISSFKKVVGQKYFHRFIFTGVVDYKQMPLYFSLLDIGVIPYPDKPHFRHFMSPLKLFDYLAAGVPMVASDLPALREVIDEKNAIFVEPEKPQSLSKAIVELLGDSKRIKQFKINNRKLAQKYTWENRVNKLLGFIKV